MRAIYLVKHGAADRAFEIKDSPDPTPKAGQVRIHTEVSGLNFADVMARLGLYQEAPPLPSVLGYEVVGRVDAVGAQVTHVKVGQRVLAFTFFGGYASSVLTDARMAIPIPEDAAAAAVSALGTQYTTAYFAAEEMVRLHPGDHVLVQAAAGGVGTAFVQLAKRRGCVVYGTAGSEAKIEYLKKIGVDHPINYTETEFDQEFLKISGGRKADVIFDSLGGSAVKKGVKILAGGGRIVCLGASQMVGERANLFRTLSTVAGFGFLHPIGLMTRSKSFIGVNMLRVAEDRPDVLVRCMQNVVNLYVTREIQPTVSGVFAPEEIGKAHEHLGMRGSIGKVAIRWREP